MGFHIWAVTSANALARFRRVFASRVAVGFAFCAFLGGASENQAHVLGVWGGGVQVSLGLGSSV